MPDLINEQNSDMILFTGDIVNTCQGNAALDRNFKKNQGT
jgi:hypothetical protein